MMKTIENSIPVNVDLKGMTRVVDLIYYDGPLLSQYINKNGDNYLFYWVDCDETYNRWIVVRTTGLLINKYIEKEVTLYDVITNPCDGFVYSVDVDSDVNYTNVRIVEVKALPDDYKPRKKSYYEFEPVNRVDTCAISEMNNSGIMELHFTGDGVGNGSISEKKFGAVLASFDEIKRSITSDYIKNYKKVNGRSSVTIDMSDELEFDYIGSMTGSFRAFFKPKTKQLSCAENNSDFIAKDLLYLLNCGTNIKDIVEWSHKFSYDSLKSYSKFVSIVGSNNLSVDVIWSNYVTKNTEKSSIDNRNYREILNNLSKSINTIADESFDVEGKFFSLNLRTLKFGFEEDGSKKTFKGIFTEAMLAKALCLSMDSIYKVKISRIHKHLVGKKPSYDDLITSIEELN
ncbi:MAG: hypothetical protein K6G31_04500 [Paludibacteraceae bacterium]|nr:hypothetical protein [Paludibacteraceae bacterium]